MEDQLDSADLALYARHFSLPGFSHETQRKLKRARVLVVGAGGLGCPALMYLVGAGIGHIGIVDGDTVSLSNIHRQTLFRIEDAGQSKVDVACHRLRGIGSYTEITGYQTFLTEDNAARICANYDVIVDGSDNFKTKYLLDAVCEQHGIPLVYASIFQFEGQLSVFHWKDDPKGPKRYRDLYPSPPPANAVGNCSEAGVVGVLPGVLGVMQANEVIKLVTGIGTPLASMLLTYDALSCQSSVLHIKRRAQLPTPQEPVAVCGTSTGENEISAELLLQRLQDGNRLHIVDVRSLEEHAANSIGGICIPLPKLPEVAQAWADDHELVFYCQSGMRSRKALDYMIEMGRQRVYTLSGGMAQLRPEYVAKLKGALSA